MFGVLWLRVRNSVGERETQSAVLDEFFLGAAFVVVCLSAVDVTFGEELFVGADDAAEHRLLEHLLPIRIVLDVLKLIELGQSRNRNHAAAIVVLHAAFEIGNRGASVVGRVIIGVDDLVGLKMSGVGRCKLMALRNELSLGVGGFRGGIQCNPLLCDN